MPYKQVSIITKRYRDRKPPVGSQINWGHPLARGLVGCWLMNEGGGNILNDLVGKRVPIGTSIWQPTPKGIGNRGTNSGNTNVSTNNLNFTSGGFTLITFFYQFAGMGTNNTILFQRQHYTSDADNAGWRIGIRSSGDAFIPNKYFFLNSNNVSLQNAWIASTTNNGIGFWMVAGVSDGTTIKRIYINGKQENTGTTYLNPLSETSANLVCVGRNSPTIVNIMCLAYNRVLSPSEIRSLYEAPYQFIQPIVRRFYLQTGAVANKLTRRRVMLSCN